MEGWSIHPDLRTRPRIPSGAEGVYLETIDALVGSQRSDEEMAEAVSVLNPILDARRTAAGEDATHLDEISFRIRRAARGAESARSGMGVDLCLDLLRLALDDAKEALRTLGG